MNQRNLIGLLLHLSKFQPIVCVVSFGACTRPQNDSNRKRTMLDFFAKSKKTKTTDNDGGESQEASSSSSSTDCQADKSASVQHPNESVTWAASDQPSTSGQKKPEK